MLSDICGECLNAKKAAESMDDPSAAEIQESERGHVQVANTPDKERWTAWVFVAWLLAAIAVVSGVAIISTMGTIEVPKETLYGSITEERPNYFIWAAAIGQALGALLFAALISMVNSIYQNSCDQLQRSQPPAAPVKGGAPPSKPKLLDRGDGVYVAYVNEASSLYGVVEPGDLIKTLNGKEVESIRQASSCLVDGENEIVFVDAEGESHTQSFKSSNGSLGIRSRS
ncbi:hypothetical protein [Chromohalobacter israelensis]|uniref:hypothetical protein n=1 Tax=Chromohalobacter israelensis TaxID=141390 RepID=UPI000FFE4CD7|nr:hypothetical protein [Chromohalobacter salexigens]